MYIYEFCDIRGNKNNVQFRHHYLLVGFFVGRGVVGLFVGDSDGGAVVGGKVA